MLLPQVYDVMAWVQALMVKSQSTHVRQVCASALLQYLLDYPLGPKRLQQVRESMMEGGDGGAGALQCGVSFSFSHATEDADACCKLINKDFKAGQMQHDKAKHLRLSACCRCWCVQHLSFLATNLSYEHELGRLQVLDMLNQVS
jgi:hypothetical protein